jgi:hypothetical protein
MRSVPLVAKREPCALPAYGAEMIWHAQHEPMPNPVKSLRPDVSRRKVHARISVPHPKPEFNVEVERAFPNFF